MEYTDLHMKLREHFNLGESTTRIPDSRVLIRKFGFDSPYNFLDPAYLHFDKRFLHNREFYDPSVTENSRFRYPVFLPDDRLQFDEAIVVLHGLNERNWNKYLSWGYTLAEQTKKAVILFPISFHINRAPEDWSNPRKLGELLTERKSMFPNLKMSTHINLALSRRLTQFPERFFLSGYQSLHDLDRLIRQIHEGGHGLFREGTKIDFFAYSIGVFLAQTMMISNENPIIENSKFFLFCGGALFSQMNGISKYIMDNKAHERIQQYYIYEIEKEINKSRKITDVLNLTSLGKAFRSMILPDRYRRLRESMLSRFNKNIQVIAMENDRVIPARESAETIGGEYGKVPDNVSILNFPFPHLHENPFPLRIPEFKESIDRYFSEVFLRAAAFLA